MNESSRSDCLRLKPKRLLEWELDSAGRAILMRPRFGSGRIGSILSHWLQPAHYRIRLDDMGTVVWLALDGETTLFSILPKLRERFGREIEPAEERLTGFVSQMLKARLIEL